jgi:hypothetical protein
MSTVYDDGENAVPSTFKCHVVVIFERLSTSNVSISVALLPHVAATDVISVWLWVFNHDHTFAIARQG